jgi:hypothetical protein
MLNNSNYTPEEVDKSFLDNPFLNNPQNLMPDTDTTNPTIQTEAKPSPIVVSTSSKLQEIKENKPKNKTIIDNIKTKKGLYTRLKKAYLKKVATDIEEGKKSSIDLERFVYTLIEKSLSDMEK